MTPTYIRWVVREEGAARRPAVDYSGKQESVDHSSKQNSGRGRSVSLQPSLLIKSDVGMRKPHPLLSMYASAAERQTSDHDWY